MLSLSVPLRRLLAVVLPVCLFWISVACMTLCTEDSDEQQAHCATLLPDTVSSTQDRDCCPITTGLPSVLPEHRVSATPSNNHQQATLILSVHLANSTLLKREHTATPVSNSDPPFERLRTLRI